MQSGAPYHGGGSHERHGRRSSPERVFPRASAPPRRQSPCALSRAPQPFDWVHGPRVRGHAEQTYTGNDELACTRWRGHADACIECYQCARASIPLSPFAMQSMHVRDIHHNEGGTYTREGINKEERNFAGILEVLRLPTEPRKRMHLTMCRVVGNADACWIGDASAEYRRFGGSSGGHMDGPMPVSTHTQVHLRGLDAVHSGQDGCFVCVLTLAHFGTHGRILRGSCCLRAHTSTNVAL